LPSVTPGEGVAQLTLRDLLTHTAALDDLSNTPVHDTDDVLWEYIGLWVSQNVNPAKTIGGKAGTVFCYSNPSYQTLRGVIWALAGANSYHSYVLQTILPRLGTFAGC
jgi:CubicO group peptidase (beta-lactamase class C family)